MVEYRIKCCGSQGLIALLVLVMAACASVPPPPDTPSVESVVEAAPAPTVGATGDIWSNLEGIWAGKATLTPLGELPFALDFRATGGGFRAETPDPPPGLQLPPSAKQYFIFQRDQMSFWTQLTPELAAEGTLKANEERTTDRYLVYCADSCEETEVTLVLGDDGVLRLTARLRGSDHAIYELSRPSGN